MRTLIAPMPIKKGHDVLTPQCGYSNDPCDLNCGCNGGCRP